MNNDTTVNVRINGQDNTKEAVEHAQNGFSGLWKSISGGVIASQVAFAAMEKLREGVSAVTDQYKEHQQAEAQLNAAIKSTGGVAGVTADAANKLANSIMKTTPIDGEAALSAENMLLTFTTIGKDTFPTATKAVTDMATAMNGGATPSASQLRDTAIQVGKALNDPITGVTALRRVGVQLTQQQQEQIKTMMAAGNQMGAQKLILGELSREFGGSAAASLNTFSGRMTQLRNEMVDWASSQIPKLENALMGIFNWFVKLGAETAFKDVLHILGEAAKDATVFLRLLWDALSGGDPTISSSEEKFAGIAKVMSTIGYYFDEFRTAVKLVFEAISGGDPTLDKNHLQMVGFVKILLQVRDVLIALVKTIVDVAKTGLSALKLAFDLLKGSLMAVFNAFAENLMPVLKEVWDSIMRLYTALEPALTDVLKVLAVLIGTLLFTALWLGINALRILIETFAVSVHAITAVIGWIANLIGWIGTATNSIFGFGSTIVKMFIELPGRILEVVKDFKNLLYDTGKNLIEGLIRGVKDMAGHAVNAVKDVGKGMVSGFKDVLKIFSPSVVFHDLGTNIGAGLIQGIGTTQKGAQTAVNQLVTTAPSISNPAKTIMSNSSTNNNYSYAGNTQHISIGQITLGDRSAVQEFFAKINQDQINTSRGLAPVQGAY